jgi:F-type H+-transporting ATPase subunit gamma
MFSKGSYYLVKKTGQRMASDKILAQRIKSCTSIYKITKAMKMVSASKMKGDLVRLENGKDFAHQAVNMIFKCDTYMQRKALPEGNDSRELLVPITSDRGLCGGINSGIIREIKSYILTKNRKNLSLFVIGEKGAAASYRPFPDLLVENVQKMSHPCNFSMTMALGGIIQNLSSDKDKIVIIYNRFKSAIQSEMRRTELLSKKRFMANMKFQKLYQ